MPWDAVDLDRGAVRVRQALQRQAGEDLVIVESKSLAGRRTIALPVPLVELLREHRTAQDAEWERAGDLCQEHGFVFVQANGKPIDPHRDYAHWQRLLREAGVPRARLHDARHTTATVMLTMGVPPRVAMQVLGHFQISLTLGTYSHVMPELATETADRVGEALWGTGTRATDPCPPPSPPRGPGRGR